jgi:hypothetical protein
MPRVTDNTQLAVPAGRLSLLAHSPIASSTAVRFLFIVTALVTMLLMYWSRELRGDFHGLAPIFYYLFVRYDSAAAGCMLLLVLYAAVAPRRLSPLGIPAWLGDHPLRVAACTVAVLSAGCLLVYRNHPLSMDEYAAFFQSQAFAGGHLAGSFPVPLLDWLIPPGFQNAFLSVSPVDGAVASVYWPSFALLLTPFTWLGIPWACNAVISGATVIVIHRIALNLFGDREAAGFAILLTVASPAFFGNGVSYYSMPAHLLANAVYALLLLQPTVKRCALAGVVGSVALTLHNPVPHLLFALPWAVWLIARPGGWRLLLAVAAGYLPLSLLLGLGWYSFSNHLMHDGLSTTTAAAAGGMLGQEKLRMLFGLPNSTVLLARAIGFAKLWLWAVPGLLVVAAAGAWRWRRDARCKALAASAVITFGGYLLVSVDQGHGWGYRYFHSAWLTLPILAAGALARSRSPAGAEVSAGGWLAGVEPRTYLVACALASLLAGVGFTAYQMNQFITSDLSQVPAYAGREPRVIFIDPQNSFYGADLVQNDPWLRGNIMRMMSHGARDDAALIRAHFPAFHQVHADSHGSVWSAAQVPVRTP